MIDKFNKYENADKSKIDKEKLRKALKDKANKGKNEIVSK